MKRKESLLAITALTVALLSPLTARATEDDKYSGLKVATVNGDAITIKDLRSQFKNRHGGHTKFLGGEEELRTFLRITIEDRLLLQEAYELGLDSDPAVKTATDAFEINKAGDYLVNVEVDQKSEPSADDVRAVWDNYGNFLVQVREIVPLGALDPEVIITPGIFVRRIVAIAGDTALAQPGAAA